MQLWWNVGEVGGHFCDKFLNEENCELEMKMNGFAEKNKVNLNFIDLNSYFDSFHSFFDESIIDILQVWINL